MVSKMYLAMTLAMGLNNVFAEEASEPKYLWRECHTGSSRNLYDSQLEVDNVYENETIRMADYAGQVNYTYINPILRSKYKNLDLNSNSIWDLKWIQTYFQDIKVLGIVGI